MSSQFYDLVVEEWRARGIKLLPAATEDQLTRLFDDLGCQLSADVVDLYASVGGYVDCSGDGLWYLWSPEEIRAEAGAKRRPFLVFADYCLNLHQYCFRYVNPETSAVYITHDGDTLEPEPVAGSVAEFLETLLCDPGAAQAWPL